MTDEKFLYLRDQREKKSTANSARHKRTHCGKGGGVRFPSDKLTKKEREKMNGKLEVYRLNSPMSYAEFKAMPEELQISYIKLLRQKFDVPNTSIAVMMGVNDGNFTRYLGRLGLLTGKMRGHKKWDADGWNAWAYGKVIEKETEEPAFSATYPDDSLKLAVDDDNGIESKNAEMEDTLSDKDTEFICEQTNYDPCTPADEFGNTSECQSIEECAEKVVWSKDYKVSSIVPETGSLTFTGDAKSIVNTLTALLGNTKVLLTVKWDVVE